MKKKLIAGNWKMNGSLAANASLLQAVLDGSKGMNCQAAVCVPAAYLAQVQTILSGQSLVALGAQLVDDLGNFQRIPVQNGIRHQAQAAGFIHNFLIIPRRKFALIGKENAPRQLMAIFPFVELELHRAPQLPIGQIP